MNERSELPSHQEINCVLEFLPKLRAVVGGNPDPVSIKVDSKGRRYPMINYGEVGLDLLRIISNQPWCTSNYDRDLAKQTVNELEALQTADLADIKNALYALTRVEHFCPGAWESYVNDGVLLKLLERLAIIEAKQSPKESSK